ncbi:MAG: radical SAM protein [Nitrososphaera sp.]|nr:radical SAM protein [Nitrososphaera sp.]
MSNTLKVSISYPPIPTDKGSPLLSQNRQFQYFNEPTFIYPVIPAYAATLCHLAGHEAIWDDAISEQKTYDSWIREVQSNPPDLICIETKTPTIKWYWKVIDAIKEASPGTKTVLYGDHVTALPVESFRNSKVDYVIRGGDYDRTILSLADSLEGKAKMDGGIWFRDGKGIKNSGDFTQKKDMTDLPFIDRDLTKWKLYSVHNGNYKVTPGTYTMAGRDCWYRTDGGCTFCSWTTHYPQFTVRTPRNVLDEVGHLINNYGIREIFDDTGTFPIGAWLNTFCNGMVERGYNEQLYFGCNMRFGALTFEEYKLMKKANFRFMLFGVESANQRTIDMLNKGVKEQEQIDSCINAAKAGLDPHLTIMFGYPWETRKEAMKTMETCRWLIKKGYAKTWQVTIVIPYPGTPLFDLAKMNGWLRTEDWERYDMREPIMKTEMKEEEVLEIVQKLYKVALDPEFILRKVAMIRTFDDLKFMLRGARNIFGHIKDFAPEQISATLRKQEEPIVAS